MGINSNKKHPQWKGEKASSSSKHNWINRHFGKANKCENPNCDGTSKCFEWANLKNHKHTRKRKDYKMMCRKCHSLFDKSKTCWNGHSRNKENTLIKKSGYRQCKICQCLAREEYKPLRRILRSEGWKMLKYLYVLRLLGQSCGENF